MTERRKVALFSAVATYLFWIEHLPPFKQAQLWSDTGGFNWPLLSYALYRLRHFAFPLWDPSIYCGIPFAANIQAALFYPGTWVLFVANLGQPHMRFKTVEIYTFAHIWLAFYLCYRWLRAKPHSLLASLLGASVFAFGGYTMSQSSHLGILTSYVWMPLAWLGIDESLRDRSWRPMWKVLAAAALSFLAGYPASWAALCISTVVYAAARNWRAGLATIVALAASLPLVAVQLLPAAEAAALKTFDPKYGWGIRDVEWYVSLVLPNYFDFGRQLPKIRMYLYLGVPALFGLFRIARRELLPAAAVIGVSAVFLTNPFDLIRSNLAGVPVLYQLIQTISFVEAATLAFAWIAAAGVDAFRTGRARPVPRWLAPAAVAALALVAGIQIAVWPRGGPDFPAGAASIVEPPVLLALFSLALYAFRSSKGLIRTALAVALCASVFVDFKAHGTLRKFTSVPGDADDFFPRAVFLGVANPVYDILKANRHYRIALDQNPHTTDMRRYALASPQGFDPLLPKSYWDFIGRYRPFETNRLFSPKPGDDALLQATAVRYFITRPEAPLYAAIASDPDFRYLGSDDSFFRVYEYTKAQAPWRWEGAQPARIEMTKWDPERREFRVTASSPGRLVLVEQFYPGWRAAANGRTVAIERWNETFQSIALPAGDHLVSFRYLPASVFWGALISLVSLAALLLVFRTRTEQRTQAGGH